MLKKKVIQGRKRVMMYNRRGVSPFHGTDNLRQRAKGQAPVSCAWGLGFSREGGGQDTLGTPGAEGCPPISLMA